MKIKNFIGVFFVLLISLAFASAITLKSVSTSPEEVAPGQTIDVHLKFENDLDYDITDLRIKLDLSEAPFAPYQSSSEKYLDELEEDEDETFRFDLIALPEIVSGIYKIPVKISYKDYDEDDEEKSELISITVNSKPELKVSSDNEIILIKGQENEIEIKIINSGLSDVKFVYLQATDISGIKFLSEREQYIGDIDSDDFESVKYDVYLDSMITNSVHLPLVLNYKDATNKEYSETKTINLRIYSLKEAQSLGLVEKPSYMVPTIISLVVVGYFVRRYFKKRKMKNNKKTLEKN